MSSLDASQQVAAPVATDTDGAPAALRAKGLTRPVAPTAALSYSGPSDDGGVDNELGQPADGYIPL